MPPRQSLPASHPLSVAIIGNDMLLAALPATPVQLAHACYQLGFEIVVPASWGDELVAHAVLEDLRHRDREPVIQCTCPLVAERLLANGQHLLSSMVQTASPAVAAARYARHAFAPRDLNITYIGACPGARDAAIDERCVPDELLRTLGERDISLADMPTVFDSVLPPDRRRFYSLPGGCPTQEALWQASDGRMLREVTQPTFSTDLAQTLVWREHVMVDVAPSLGCACAGSCSRLGARSGRVAVMAVEPPRASQAVVNFKPEFAAPAVEPLVTAESANGDTPRAWASRPRDEAPLQPQLQDEGEPVAGPLSGRTAEYSAATSRVRGRVRSTTPLPRAYLAKRRHLTTSVPTSEAAPAAVESESVYQPIGPLAAAFEKHEEALAESGRESLVMPNEGPVAKPNEIQSEPADVGQPIAVHVEPALPRPDEVTDQAVHPPQPDVSVEAGPDLQGQLFVQETSAEVVATATLNQAEGSPSPSSLAPEAETPVDSEEPVEEPPPIAERSGPLRVEVEIFEEPEPPPQEGVVMPDAIENEQAKNVAAPEIVVRPRSAWADFLIALWLLLVASAVIATLLWRR